MNESAATWSQAVPSSWSTSPSFGQGSNTTWESPCEAMFEYLAHHDAGRLLAMVTALTPAQLTHAAEWIGRSRDPRAWTVLASMLRHPSALVREGAIIGLEALGTLALQHAKPLLIERALEDSEQSPGVRAAAMDALSLLALG